MFNDVSHGCIQSPARILQIYFRLIPTPTNAYYIRSSVVIQVCNSYEGGIHGSINCSRDETTIAILLKNLNAASRVCHDNFIFAIVIDIT